MDWTGSHGWMGVGWIFMLLFWALLIIGLFAIIRWLSTSARQNHRDPNKRALETLKDRYARGEIEREEYEQKRRDIDR